MKTSLTLKGQTFAGKRFSLCLREYLGENWRKILLLYGAGLGTLIVVAVFSGLTSIHSYEWRADHPEDFFYHYNDPALGSEVPFFILLSMFFAAITASMVFKDLGSKEGRIYRLTSPSSQLEKYFVGLLLYVVLFLVALAVGVVFADGVRAVSFKLFSSWGDQIEYIIPYFVEGYEEADGIPTATRMLTLVLLFVQSIFVIGSAVWPKGAFLKTAAAVCVIGMVYALAAIISSNMIPDSVHYFVRKNNQTAVETTVYIIGGAVILFNYWIAYLRFKEIDIIDRW